MQVVFRVRLCVRVDPCFVDRTLLFTAASQTQAKIPICSAEATNPISGRLMIFIQVQLAYVAVASLLVAFLAAASAVVGLLLGVHHYSHRESLQISSCLTGAVGIIAAFCQLYAVAVPYTLKQVALNVSCVLLLTGSGLYYLCARLQVFSDLKNSSLEIAFVCLWLLLLVSLSLVTSFSLGAAWVANYGPEEGTVSEKSNSEANSHIPNSETMLRTFLFKKIHASNNSVHSFGAAVHIPTVPVSTSRPCLSPRLSCATSFASMRLSHSLDSLTSVLDTRVDTRIVTPPAQQLNSSHQLSQSQHSLVHSEAKSPSIKPPKSPVKLHLSRSSFSLKRSSSRASHLKKQSHNKHRSISHGPKQNPIDTVALGISHGIQVSPGTETHKNWVIIPNENAAESRSVSGSSQLTGTIFPASEYNRRINAAGFQRDEPVPVQVHAVRNTVSQYDLECLHKQQKGHMRVSEL